MKKRQILAWGTFLLTFVFMIAAVKNFQDDQDEPFSNTFPFHFSIDWDMTSLNGAGARPQVYDHILETVEDAVAAGNCQKVNLPYQGRSSSDDIIVFKTMFPEECPGLTLRFVSMNTAICVFMDKEQIYKYGFLPNGTPAEVIEKSEHTIYIPNVSENSELWIVQASTYPNAAATLSNVEINPQGSLVINVIGNNITDVGCCLLIMLMAFLFFVLALIRKYTHQPARGEMYLGFVCIAAGIDCIIATDTLSIFYNIHAAYAMPEYLKLIVTLFLAMYFEHSLSTIYPRRYSVLLVSVLFSIWLQLVLNASGLQNIPEITILKLFTSGAICLTAVLGLIQFFHSHRYRRILLAAAAVCILLVGGIAGIVLTNINQLILYQYSITIFSILMAVVHVLQLSREYRENVEKSARLLEEELKIIERQNQQLARAKQDADAARHEAMTANESKGKFLAHMSHEIRTPINAVLGMDEMILRESKEPGIKEYAMDIYTAGQTLLSLINDILDFSKIESGKMEIVPVIYDPGSLIHDLTNMTTQQAKSKDILFEVSVDPNIPCQLYGDDVRIRQVLTNILTNAVKYTHEGTVWLRVKGFQADETAVLTFEVEDTGIGIREEDLPKLSAEFERIEEDKNRNIEGTGLGMSITIRLLALLGSKLQVESVYGKGSKFFFTLEQKIVNGSPIGDFKSRVLQNIKDYHYNAGFCAPNAKILVTDDNAVNRRVLRNLLKETCIQVTDAVSGTQCLDLVQKNHYDLIFLDHMMPEMDGIETLHRIKAMVDCPCQNTPVVVLTANAVSGAKEQYLSEGFDDFLSKPVIPEKLETLIKELLPEELLTAPASQDISSSSSDFPEGLPSVDGLNWEHAWMHLPDKDLLEYALHEFYDQINSSADRLKQTYEQIAETGQLEQYRIQVHAMKGLAATVGILPLSGIAALLESASRDGNLEVITSVTPAFLTEWRSYRQRLQGVFDIGSAPQFQINDTSIILALLEMIRFSIQELDIDKADQLMKQLQAYSYPDEMMQNVRKLAHAVTNLDPAETDIYAELLMEQLSQ